MDERIELDPETRRIIEESGRELMAKRAGKRTVSQLIAEDKTPRPYSVRLTPAEIHRLRTIAYFTKREASVLARQFIQEGLARMEAEYARDPIALEKQGPVIAIKLALLDVLDRVTAMEYGEQLAAGTEAPEPPGA